MQTRVFDSVPQLGQAAADRAATIIQSAIAQRGRAYIVVATGMSQVHFLAALVRKPEIDWSRVTVFQLDEYIGLPPGHPGRLGDYLEKRLLNIVHPGEVFALDGANTDEIARRVAAQTLDVAFVGIGENGHIAFNDPPADFETEAPFIVVRLDEPCRRQQAGEGWFPSFEDVPPTAISMSIRQILKCREILCIVPEQRKARAVANALQREISPEYPASILRTHPQATLYLDAASASLLGPQERMARPDTAKKGT